MTEHNGYVEPVGFVWRRGRGCYLAHTWRDETADEWWDAFTTLRAAKHWVAEVTEMPTRWRIEHGEHGYSVHVCYTPPDVDEDVAPADLPEYA